MKTLYLAGGCFWGLEAFMKMNPHVLDTEVGYANGITKNPTYEDVCHHNSGHAETVCVKYDEKNITTKTIVEQFFSVIDPTTKHRQGNDIGSQYRSGIYYIDESDVESIKEVMREVQKAYDIPLVVEVLPLSNYYVGEDYHQDYLDKNPNGYCHINLQKAKESL